MSESSTKKNSKLVEEIKIFIEYSVAEEERSSAVATVEQLRENTIALLVLGDFYRRLPEFRQEAVSRVSRIISRRDAYLLAVDTANYEYLYFYNEHGPVYLGEKKEGIGESEILGFFGYSSDEEFLKRATQKKSVKDLPQVFCPACGVAEGEDHLLGCPVEICPWCAGQFTYCNCRFDYLGVDEITETSQLERLEVILDDKGRIPFSADHAPGYPQGGGDEE